MLWSKKHFTSIWTRSVTWNKNRKKILRRNRRWCWCWEWRHLNVSFESKSKQNSKKQQKQHKKYAFLKLLQYINFKYFTHMKLFDESYKLWANFCFSFCLRISCFVHNIHTDHWIYFHHVFIYYFLCVFSIKMLANTENEFKQLPNFNCLFAIFMLLWWAKSERVRKKKRTLNISNERYMKEAHMV